MDYFDKRDNVEGGTDNVSNQLVDVNSEIQVFYENKNVFITDDASGLGGVLAERLLRSCPKIGMIYLLMKPEKNKSHKEKYEEFLFSEDYEKTDQTHQYFKTKIKIIHGDYTQPLCGISESNQKILKDEIQIVFHCLEAADKHENLKILYNNNIQSTKSLLEMACKMKKIKAFICVSTIYENNFQPYIEDKFNEQIFSNNNSKSWEELLQVIALKIIGNRGELNDFTKAVAEEVVREYQGKVPIVIARFSNGGCYQKDSTLKWKKLFNLPSETHSVLISALKYYEHGIKENFIPTDNIINTIIAISWQIGTDKSDRSNIDTPVYDITSSWNSEIPKNCGEHLTEDSNLIYQAISEQCLGTSKLHENNHKLTYYHKKFIHPVLYLLMLNLYLKIYANAYKLWNTFVKTDFSLSSQYHNPQARSNKPSNVEKLWSSMTYVDKKLFNFDIINNDWEQCSSRNIRNMIAYLFKEDLSDLEMTNTNYVRYKQAKMCLKILLYSYSFYLFFNRYVEIIITTLDKCFL